MNVIAMALKIPHVSNAMVCEPELPNLPLSPYFRAKGVRKASLDELNGVFKCYILPGCDQKMGVLRH